MRPWSEVGKDTVEGTCRGGIWGGLIGGLGTLAVVGLATVATGGAALPALLAALPAAGGAAVTGAEVGAGVGGVMGATGYKEEIDKAAAAAIVLGASVVTHGAGETPRA